MSFRTGWSLLLGGLLTYGVLAPALVAAGRDPDRRLQGDRRLDAVARRRDPGRLGPALVRFRVAERRALVRRARPRSFAARPRDADPTRSPPSSARAGGFPPASSRSRRSWSFLMGWLFQIPLWAGVIARAARAW